MLDNIVELGDCLDRLRDLPPRSVDLIYLDPPFFTNRNHYSSTRDGSRAFSFSDNWNSKEEYIDFMLERIKECQRILKDSGSIYFHGDHNNIHLARYILDQSFGENNFQSEIVWHYKRWSNAKKGLLQQHQSILFYTKTENFKWNQTFTDYSATTNIDQIMQKRTRDDRGKAIYATDTKGNIIFSTEKKGVPLGDVWEIPFLNPKARERTGYPTQKPLVLLERLIALTTEVDDIILDPFCGSGTTLVASKLMGRRYIGFDISENAVSLARERLEAPTRTDSDLLKKGIASYQAKDPWVEAHLAGIEHIRVQRNIGIDALLKSQLKGKPCFIRVQRKGETLAHAVQVLTQAAATKGEAELLAIATAEDMFPTTCSAVHIIRSNALQIEDLIRNKTGQATMDLLHAERLSDV